MLMMHLFPQLISISDNILADVMIALLIEMSNSGTNFVDFFVFHANIPASIKKKKNGAAIPPL